MIVGVKRLSPSFVFFVSAFISMAVLHGCGYSVHRHISLPFKEISIGTIENRTLEPKLQDMLQRALTEEFLKQGISVIPSARYKITAVIRTFTLVGISAKDNINVEYRVIMGVDFTVLEGGKTIKEIKNVQSPFISAFTGAANMGNLLAAKEVAEESLANDVAMEIVGALIYINTNK